MARTVVKSSIIGALTLAFAAQCLADDYFIVLGSYRDEDSASRGVERIRQRLDSDTGIVVRSFDVRGERFFRVMAGPLIDGTTAGLDKQELVARGFEDAWILVLDSAPDESPSMIATEAPVAPPVTTVPVPEEPVPAGIERRQPDLLPPAPPGGTAEESGAGATISLAETIKLALERNLGLQASVRSVRSGAEAVSEARAGLRPNITAGVTQTAIDQDRAEASLGRAPEYRTTARLTVSQSLYSDRAIAAVQIQELLQKARENDRRKVALDTIFEASVTFLKLLRTRALAAIVSDDLELTRSNYERAQVRLELGVANRSEVYRWQTRLAGTKRELNLAESEVEKARIALNEIVNRPLGKAIHPEKPSLASDDLLFTQKEIRRVIQNEAKQTKLKDYWITEALLFAPELDVVRNQRAAQYRTLLAARRRVLIPEILLSIDATKHVAEDGVGTEEVDFQIPGSETRIGGKTDNVEWSAAVTASLPLYGGGGNRAAIRKARADSERLDLLYDEALLAIQSGVLQNFSGFKASLNNIELARDAAEASRNNLDLVASSYERGVVTIIDLLDAQVAALSAELSAANAEYDFLIEYMKLQRTVGRFDIALTEEERAAARARLEPYLQ